MEVRPVVLAVTAIVGAAGRAEAVGGRASQDLLSAGSLLRLLLRGEPGRGDPPAGRRYWLRLDVYALAGVDR